MTTVLTLKSRKKLATAMTRIEKAEDAMMRTLEKMFPLHHPIRFHIQHGQINPSHGTVIGHEGGRFAYLRVRLRSRTEQVRSVPARNVW